MRYRGGKICCENQHRNGGGMTLLLFSFVGRAGRAPFWLLMIVMFVGQILATVADLQRSGHEFGSVSGVFLLIILWPALAIQAKRWHDRNKSAWWILLNGVPVIGPIWTLIECGFLPGTPGPNKFGQLVPLPRSTYTGWVRLGVVVSIIWTALASGLYLRQIDKYPATSLVPHAAFNWVEDPTYSDAEYTLLKPTVSAAGMLMVILAPLASGWLLGFILFGTVRWVRAGFLRPSDETNRSG